MIIPFKAPLIFLRTAARLRAAFLRCMSHPHGRNIQRAGLALLCLMILTAPVAANDWFAFDPQAEIEEGSPLSLRGLNEAFAGEHGFIVAKNGRFVHSDNQRPVRFWAVNGPPDNVEGDELKYTARLLAHYGVNLVRVHSPLFDKQGDLDPAKIKRAHEIVAAMKAEGIYTHFSIYFPLWMTPAADSTWLQGYDGQQHPFAALQFNREFQERHRGWLKALLTTKDEQTGKSLLDDPAVFGVEIQNEDSFFFWTFNEKNIPDPQLKLLEAKFGEWAKAKHGSLEAALEAWNGQTTPRDALAAGRLGFRPLWNIAHEKTARDQETARFLFETQTAFYRDTYAFLRELGFKGLIHGSNWTTADPQTLGPLEKMSYTVGDFVDRHGYFECNHKGEHAAWSIRPGHTFSDRSALRFDAPEPGGPKQFVHPIMDPQYGDKPSMISETTFTRPNRHRSEAALYFAAYGALQDSDCIVHFALDGVRWHVKPQFWMQPWTLATPAMLGQFPAAARIYRQGLVATGDIMADVRLNREKLLQLQGTPLPQDAALDELRLKDLPAHADDYVPGQRIDPLVHYVGRTRVRFVDDAGGVQLRGLEPFVDHAAQTVRSATGELKLDYGRGVLVINAPQAQGISGNLQAAGPTQLDAVKIACDLDLAHIIVTALDGQPLKTSRRMLMQAMTEERATDFAVEKVDEATKKITNLGRDPWQARRLNGTVELTRPDANRLKVTRLDFSGKRQGEPQSAERITLAPDTLYYLIEE